MTWLILCGPQNGVVSRCPVAEGAPETPQFLLTGSLVLEMRQPAGAADTTPLLDMRTNEDWPARLTITRSAAHSFTATLQQGHAVSRVSVSGLADALDGDLRLTYSWDGPARHGVLTVEHLDDGLLHQAEFDTPQPLPLPLVDQIARAGDGGGDTGAQMSKTGTNIAESVQFIGISDRIEPVGLVAGLARGTVLETPAGPRRIETLHPGDLVLTQTSGSQPVRWIGAREVPVMGRFRPVHLRAPYLGLSRDVVVAPEQRVQMDSIEVEYLFGEDRVLAEARDLTHGNWAQPYRGRRTLKLYHVLLDRHEVLNAAGCRLESLYIGQIAEDPGLLPSTILAGLPTARIPRHANLACPVLRPYEATTLQTLAPH